MGTNDKESFPNERPAHLVQVQGFWMDEHDVTNSEFSKFVEATGYVTTAERKDHSRFLSANRSRGFGSLRGTV
jgi:formylglycine-generating enzyme